MTDRLTITLCGSLSRAAHDLHRVHRALALAGHIVHAPVPALPGEATTTLVQRANLATRHRAAIERSDLVIAVVPDGKAGRSTNLEMDYADDYGARTRWAMSPADVDVLLADIAAGRRLDRAEVPA